MHGDGDDYPPSRRITPGPSRGRGSTSGVEHQRPLLGTPYVLEGAVGKGGMSQVYRGLHVELDRPVAVKLLNPNLVDHPEALSRLRREARLLARLGNPHVVHVYDLGVSEDGLPYIAMQLLEGDDLRTMLTNYGRLGFQETVHIAMQVANALQAVHEAGLVHRDLKPENVLLEERASGIHVTVLDFGIAHIRESTETKLTVEGQLVGTPGYIAPELLIPGTTPNAFADQYSLGVLIYEMLTGRTPHEGDSVLQILNAQNANPPAPIGPYLVPGEVSKHAQWAIMKALSRNPENRFADIAEFIDVLRSAGQTASRVGPGRSGSKSRNLILAAALIGGLVGGLYTFLSHRTAREHPTVAAAPVPAKRGTLKVGWGRSRGRFSVYPLAESSSMVAMELITETLIGTTHSGQYLPRAAAHWEVAVDGKSVVIEVRKGAKFNAHPCLRNGQMRQATSADLAYSIELRNQQTTLFKPGFGPTEIIDDYRARVTFIRPSPFPEALLSTVFLVPKELGGDCDDPNNLTKPVGTGPYRLANIQRENHLRLDRNPAYWKKGVPRLDHIDIFTVPDDREAFAGILRGRLDFAKIMAGGEDILVDPTAVQPELKPEYQNKGIAVHPRNDPNSILRFGILFLGEGPHQIHDVRRAIAIGIDRKRVIERAKVHKKLTDRYLDDRFLGFDRGITGFGSHVEEARRLVGAVKAKHRDLKPLVLGAMPGRDIYAKTIAAELDAIGLPNQVLPIRGEALNEMIETGAIDAIVTGEYLHSFGTDPLPVLLDFKLIGAPDPVLDELRSNASTELDRKTRGQMYADIEQRLLQLVPYVPIAIHPLEQPMEQFMAGPRVAGAADPITDKIDAQLIDLFSRVHLKADAPRKP